MVGDDGVLCEMVIFKLRLRWLRRLQSPIIWYHDLLVIGVKRLGKLNGLRLLLGLLLKVVSLKRLSRACHIHTAAVRLLLGRSTRRIVHLLLWGVTLRYLEWRDRAGLMTYDLSWLIKWCLLGLGSTKLGLDVLLAVN